MIADYHFHYLQFIRNGVSIVVAPLQYTVDYPVRILSWVNGLVSTKKKLVEENIQLHYEQALLEAKLQKLLVIRKENAQLKALLMTSSHANAKTAAARILAVDTSTSRQILIVDKGKKDGTFVGQAVLDAEGVMGQIIDVGLLTSTVMLISDAKSAVPVQNNRTGEHAILIGANHLNKLALIHLPKTSNIEKGDTLITSGLGRRYPEGYPVGIVQEVKHVAGEAFIKVVVTPIALLNRNRLVLLIWPEAKEAQLTREILERLAILDKKYDASGVRAR